MLPRTWLPDQDLVLCASLRRNVTTSSIHPLYLPPIVCWLNATQVRTRVIKLALLSVLKVISTLIALTTLFVHAVRLCNISSLDIQHTLWSSAVCTTLLLGFILSVLSSDNRTRSSDPSVLTDTLSGIAWFHKATMTTLLLSVYMYIWLHYRWCHEEHVRSPTVDMRNTHILLQWTTFAFVWINVIGFVKLRTG